MKIYAAILTVVVLLLFGAVKLIYAHGELNKVSHITAAAPPTIPAANTASSLAMKWHSDERPAGGNPYSNGIVVTYAGHTVNGRDARTGVVRWHYTRSDEDVCAVVQQDASTIAFYNRDGNCDEVTGFVTATGVPKFYRTLTDDGALSVSSTSNVVLVVSATTVHAFDNAGGIDRWLWTAPAGCRVDRALGGSIGVLFSYHCGTQNHLALHDLTDGDESAKWTINVGGPYVPIAAGAFVAAADPSSTEATIYSSDKGVAGKKFSLTGAAAGGTTSMESRIATALTALPRSQTTVEGADANNKSLEAINIGVIFCFSTTGQISWTAPSAGPTTILDDDLVSATDNGKVVLHQIVDGHEQQVVAATGGTLPYAAGVSTFAIGAGLLLAGTTTEYYS
ncbi:hypothetical protein ACSMXN_10010 [Jatrophihabitans sp. DSM 45814]